MDFELGTGTLTMMNKETGEMYDWGEITPMSIEQEIWSPKEELEKTKKGFTIPATLSWGETTIDQDLFNKLCVPSKSLGFIIEGETPILIQARWHKKARIRKKWRKRYGYKEDFLKTIIKAKYGEFNKETGECNIEIESIEYIFKPYQLQREVR